MKRYIRLAILLAITFWWVPAVLSVQREKIVPYKLKLQPSVKRRYPNAAVVDLSIPELSDTTISNPQDNQVLGYDSATQNYINQDLGIDFSASDANQKDVWVFPVEQLAQTAALNFTTGACPSGWGTNCWSVEPNAGVGSVAGVSGGTIPTDIVLVSNTRIAYASAADKRATSLWIGSTEYNVKFIAKTGTLGSREVVYSELATSLPGTNWQNVRFEYSDGTFAPATTGATKAQRTVRKDALINYLNLQQAHPTKENIYETTKEIVKAGDNIQIDANDRSDTITFSTAGSDFVAVDSLPSDFSSYVNGQILWVNALNAWYEVKGSDSDEKHGFRIKGAVDGSNANNKGFSLVGTDIYGSVSTWDGGKPLNASDSPIGRFEITADRGNLTILIKKSALSATDLARTSLALKVYQGPIGSLNYVLENIVLNKGSEITFNNVVYVTYLNTPDGSAAQLNTDFQYLYGFRLFSRDPGIRNDVDNAIDLHGDKSLFQIDIPAIANTPRRVTTLPDDADSLVGDDVYLTANYNYVNGFDITPASFTDSPIDGEGYGTRGWYDDPAKNYDVGRMTPAPAGDLLNVYLISDTTVLVKDGTLTNLASIVFNTGADAPTECSLTRTDQTNVAVSGADTRNVDSYSIASSCVPSGDWDDVSFKSQDTFNASRASASDISISGHSGSGIPALAGSGDTLWAFYDEGFNRVRGTGFRLIRYQATRRIIGACANSTTLWVADGSGGSGGMRAFTIDSSVTFGTRNTSQDISNVFGRCAAISATIWVVNNTTNMANAYNTSNGSADTTKNISLGTGDWRGAFSDGTTLWFTNNTTNMAVAYTASTQARDSGKDFAIATNYAAYNSAYVNGFVYFDQQVAQRDSSLRAYSVAVTTGATVPASVAITSGDYTFEMGDWHKIEDIAKEINDRIDDRVDSWARTNSTDKIPATALASGVAGLNQTAVDARVNAKVPQQFRSDADTSGTKFQPLCFEDMTSAQYTAATKQANCLYFVDPPPAGRK